MTGLTLAKAARLQERIRAAVRLLPLAPCAVIGIFALEPAAAVVRTACHSCSSGIGGRSSCSCGKGRCDALWRGASRPSRGRGKERQDAPSCAKPRGSTAQALNTDRVDRWRARADCRVSVADCRSPIVGRFDAPSCSFAGATQRDATRLPLRQLHGRLRVADPLAQTWRPVAARRALALVVNFVGRTV
jgi:hypothetical protein